MSRLNPKGRQTGRCEACGLPVLVLSWRTCDRRGCRFWRKRRAYEAKRAKAKKR